MVRRMLGAVLAAVLALGLLLLPALPLGNEPLEAAPTPSPTAAPVAKAEDFSLAVWVSYLEWETVDFSSAGAFTADVTALLDNIAALGARVVLAQVRPFGDALYPSTLFPFSHLCTGVQGQDPGFDPLAILVTLAHARGLEVEAWLNPYRLQAGGVPAALCEQSLAVRHPDWVKDTGSGLYLDPASGAVRQYIADGIEELCQSYAIDGIHLDDYFYPTTDPAFDAADYAAAGTALSLEDWRRDNVNALVALCWQTAHRYGVRFGIAPQGDPDTNYSGQYSDAARWLAEPGYVDYLMPQLYWGLDYSLNGDSSHSLAALAARWLALPRAGGVALYFGLGAYRIGDGDGSDTGAEWRSGCALAGQLGWLRAHGAAGAGLYRYASLFDNRQWPRLAAAEVAALTP
ncbi:MAG: glycoside hydrolase family 10 protein [Gemmiger sp.]